MEVVHERCCGLDIHKRTVVACLLTPGERGQPGREVRSFSTMTRGLLALSDWLRSEGCTHIAMESTGSFWKPVYNLLEDSFTLLLVNAQHLKAVPGRKRDVKDAEVNRVQKVLEGANIKLAAVASSVMGVSGRAMLEAMVAGIEAPEQLAELARGRLREKLPALEEALAGRLGTHQRFLLSIQLRHIDDLDTAIGAVVEEIEARLRPFEEATQRLMTIPGVGKRTAQTILSEVGTDVGRFPTGAHLASWAALCPGNHESAGKQKSGRSRKGNPWLRAALVEAAQAASHTKSYLAAQYRRLAARRGARRAVLAVAHSLLLIAFHLMKHGGVYQDLGANYFDQRDQQRVEKRLVRRLQALGYAVSLQPAA